MKILISTNHSLMLHQYRGELIEELAKNNEIVCVMPFTGHIEEFEQMGIRCVEIEINRRGINPVTDFKLLTTYHQIIKREQPDLVITYSIKPNIYAGTVCKLLRIPYCSHVQGLGSGFEKPGIAQLVTLMYRFALGKVKMVFFENEVNAKVFRDRKIVTREKQTVLPGAGVNLERYSYQTYPDNEKIRFAYLGRIMKEKGMDELFAASVRLHEEGYSFILDLAGFFEDEYKERVEMLQEKGIVEYHGFIEDTRPIYAAADCIVLPSYHEGMSNVLLEGAATGRALITSNIPGCREAVDNGKTGFLCEVKSTDDLYKTMKRFLDLSRDEREQMGIDGRTLMEKKFKKEIVVKMTIDAIKRCIPMCFELN